MAKQVQFRGATKAKGFSPQQVSDAAISRMREESNRVVRGMQAAAQSDISQRQRIAQEMKENQQYEQTSRKRNYDVQTQNQSTEIRQTQLDSETAKAQLISNQNAQSAIFANIANLSNTAVEKYEEIQKVKSDERAQEAINEFLINPNQDKIINQVLGEYELAATEEVRQSELDVAKAKGGDPLAISKVRSLDSNGRYKLDQARVNYILTNIYPQQLNKALSEAGELDSAETAAFLANFKREFFEKTNVLAYKPEMVRDGLAALQRVDQGVQTKARAREEKQNSEIRVANATTILTQNPTAFLQNVPSSFRTYQSEKGNAAAIKWLTTDIGLARGANGEYLFKLDQIGAAEINTAKGQAGKPFAVTNPGAYGALKIARMRGDNQYREALITAESLGYKEQEKTFLQGLTEDSSQEAADKAVLFFQETYGRVPQSIQRFADSYTYEAVAKAKRIEALEALAAGDITQEAVDLYARLNPSGAKAFEERFSKQQVIKNHPVFKSATKELLAAANGVTSFGSLKAGTGSSGLVHRAAVRDLHQRVKDDLARFKGEITPDIVEQYITKHSLAIGGEISGKKGKYTPSGELGPGNRRVFPLLEKTDNLTPDQLYSRKLSEIRAIAAEPGSGGLRALLSKKDAVMTTPEIEAVSNTYLETGEYPLFIYGITEMTKGGDPFVIMNKLRQAQGLTPLEPPQLVKDLNAQITPEIQALIRRAKNKAQAERAYRQGFSQTSGDTSAFRRSESMRAGSPMLVYTSGNIGPTSTGPHLDLKSVDGSRFELEELDDYVEVNDPEYGRVSLSFVRKKTGGIGDSFDEHVARGSHGIDIGLHGGTEIYLKNGAKVISSQPTAHGDLLTFELPNGKRFTKLHGTTKN